jgi:hypothetical protein
MPQSVLQWRRDYAAKASCRAQRKETEMKDNSLGYHHRHAIDKGIVPVQHFPGAPLNPDPHARGFKMPVHIAPETRRPAGEPAAMTPPHNPNPHPYNPASQVQQRNTYAKPRP